MSRKYRPQGLILGGMLTFCLLFLIVGASMLAASPPGDVAGRVIGAVLIVFAFVAGGAYVSGVLMPTPEGIVYRSSYRRGFVGWDSVDSFRLVKASGMGPWFNVGVELRPVGSVRIPAVRGSRRYIERVIAELEEFRTQVGAGTR